MKTLVHLIFRIRRFNNKCIKKFAFDKFNKKILEIGSGEDSAKRFFHNSNKFIQTDINGLYPYLDITEVINNEYDIIICMNVLEHIYEIHKAIENIHKALKPNGTLIAHIPAFYPLHSEPNDYWRLTEHSIKKLLSNFQTIKIKHSGMRRYPFSYYIEAIK